MKKGKIKNKGIKSNKNKKIDSIKSNYQSESNKIIKCFIIVLIIFGIMYLVTTLILKKSDDRQYQSENTKTSIQYDEILLGTTFDKKDKEYLVLFYNMDTDTKGIYGNAISDYEAKEEKIPIYYVDLSNSMNKSCLSSESNKEATKASELKINDVTLIKFSNNEIKEYITGYNSIIEYLNK